MFKTTGVQLLCCKLEHIVLFKTVNIFELIIYLPGQQNNKSQNNTNTFTKAFYLHCHLVLPCGYGYDTNLSLALHSQQLYFDMNSAEGNLLF